jgi:hypothetical protein
MMFEDAYESWEGREISSEERAAVQAAFIYMMKREETRSGEITTINSLRAPPPPRASRRGGFRSLEKKKPRIRISLAPPASDLPDPCWFFA